MLLARKSWKKKKKVLIWGSCVYLFFCIFALEVYSPLDFIIILFFSCASNCLPPVWTTYPNLQRNLCWSKTHTGVGIFLIFPLKVDLIDIIICHSTLQHLPHIMYCRSVYFSSLILRHPQFIPFCFTFSRHRSRHPINACYWIDRSYMCDEVVQVSCHILY